MARFWTLASLVAASLTSTVNAGSVPFALSVRQIDVGVERSSSVTVAQSGGTDVIVITSNQGGNSPNKYYSQPSKAAGTVHQVTVGGDAGLVYTPESITAAVGDMVQFNFMSLNHTVTQSSFGTPCAKTAGGVDSGFMPNPSNTVNPAPMLLFQVATTDPIWMYCRQQGHCEKGMVFSINPTAAKSQAAFKAAAIAQNGSASASSAGTASSSSATAVAASSSSSVVLGTGTTGTGSACACSCLCGAAAFPAGAGIGAVGGLGGELSLVGAAQKRSVRSRSH